MPLSAALPISFGQLASFVAGGTLGAVLTLRRRPYSAMPKVLFAPGSDNAMLADDRITSVGGGVRRQAVDATSAATAPRTRVGRLPLPKQVADLTPEEEPALADVNVFVDRLAELPLDGWLTIGRSSIGDHSSVGRRATAFAILEATIATNALGVAAWYARDAVETSAFVATRSAARWTSKDRRAFAAAHAAAEEAALALLAHEKLPASDFALLIEPFASLVCVEA